MDERESMGEVGLGTGVRGKVCSSVPRADFCCGGGFDRGDVVDRGSRGGERDG